MVSMELSTYRQWDPMKVDGEKHVHRWSCNFTRRTGKLFSAGSGEDGRLHRDVLRPGENKVIETDGRNESEQMGDTIEFVRRRRYAPAMSGGGCCFGNEQPRFSVGSQGYHVILSIGSGR